jgi:hypothetical protein
MDSCHWSAPSRPKNIGTRAEHCPKNISDEDDDDDDDDDDGDGGGGGGDDGHGGGGGDDGHDDDDDDDEDDDGDVLLCLLESAHRGWIRRHRDSEDVRAHRVGYE